MQRIRNIVIGGITALAWAIVGVIVCVIFMMQTIWNIVIGGITALAWAIVGVIVYAIVMLIMLLARAYRKVRGKEL